MRVAVAFQNERLDLDVPEDRLIGQWQGPAGSPARDAGPLVREALEAPHGFPPLRQAVVPGDRVAIAFDGEIRHARPVLETIAEILARAGVSPEMTTIVAVAAEHADLAENLPAGLSLVMHDPEDSEQLAYLATTAGGRRVYLNRKLIDADFVLPVGRLGYDPVLGYRGPWGVVFPGLSDAETQRDFRARPPVERPDREHPRPTLTESTEVGWLLGGQLQLGIVAGAEGLAAAVAGTDATVLKEGALAVDRAWLFEPESRAELVVVGVGRPGLATGIEELGEALATATQLVQQGGKIVALSRAEGEIGPALRRLIAKGDPARGRSALRGHESDRDFIPARQIARAVAWADVYLLSKLDQDDVENLSMVVLDRPEEARRLVAVCDSCLVVSQAESTRARTLGE